MTIRKYSSRSQQSTLTGAITAGAASMTVVNGTTLLGGQSIPSGTTFTLVIDPDTALEEIVDATAVSSNTFTITRERRCCWWCTGPLSRSSSKTYGYR
jgi:hypothetical protein